MKKSKEDVIYFVNKYCQLITPEGVKKFTLRDYQVRYLNEIAELRKQKIFKICLHRR